MGIADKLKQAGVHPQDNIAILVPRSEYYLLCALGVLICGAAYVPIDDTYPDDRVTFMLKDTASGAALVTKDTKQRVQDIVAKQSLDAKIVKVDDITQDTNTKDFAYHKPNPQDTACILYTSGTTGIPKGSLITRGAINNFCQWFYSASKMTNKDVYGLYASISFDVHIEMLSVFYTASTLSVIPQGVRLETDKLINYIKTQNISTTELPVSIAKLLKDSFLPKCLKVVHTGGEAVGDLRLGNQCQLIDAYGPTETCVANTWIDVSDKIHPSSIGYPLFNTKAYVLDNNLHRLPQGAIGQLYLSGYQLAKGYLNQPELTAQAFLDNPFDGNIPGYENMYATGDMVRYLPDGSLGFLGRKDTQIKIRGNRVELGEIEVSIREIDTVKDVIVQAIEANNTKELVAYVVSDIADEKQLYEQVTKHISSSKPSYMIPAFVVILGSIPLNTNGKVDKRALPKPDTLTLKAAYLPAQNETQQIIIDAFEKVLQVSPIGIDDDFIRLGGDSLKAILLLSRLSNTNITAAEILQLKTPRLIAQKSLTSFNLEKLVNKYKKDGLYPLSSSQLNIYYDQLSKSKDKAYRIIFSIECDANYLVNDIKIALQHTIEAHPILSMRIKQIDHKLYLAKGKKPTISIIEDISAFREDIDIDIFKGPLAHFAICKKGRKTYLLGVIHHIVFDGKSKDVFVKDFYDCLHKKSLHKDTYFASIAALGEHSASKKDKPKDIFDKMFSDLEINTIAPLPCKKPGHIKVPIRLNPIQVEEFCKEASITDTSYLCAVFAYTYSVFSASDTASFCMTDNGRDLAGADGAVGMFVKNIPLAISCKINDTNAYLAKVFETLYEAKRELNLPIANLSQKYGIDASVMFQYFSTYLDDENNLKLKDIKEEYETYQKDEQTIADLDFYLYKLDDGYVLAVTHSNQYDINLVKSFVATFETVAKQMLKVKLLSDIKLASKDTPDIYEKINNTETKYKFLSVLDAFNYYANKTSENKCLVYDTHTYTYKQVDELSNALANRLKKKGLGKKDSIAIFQSVSEYYLISILAIMKIGAIYVPVNIDFPDKWIKQIYSIANIQATIISSADMLDYPKNTKTIDVSDLLPRKHFAQTQQDTDDTACIIFTSGSTGIPKAVRLKHISIANLCNYHVRFLKYTNFSISGMYQSVSFVSHIEPMFAPLFRGCVVDIIPDIIKEDVEKLGDYIDSHHITHIKMGASIGRHFIDKADTSSLQSLYLSGEKLGHIDKKTSYEIVDGYGSTENTAQVLMSRYRDKNYIESIGYPIANTKAYILDRYHRLLPKCAQGILCTCGISTSKGYLDGKNNTTNAFIDNPLSNNKTYKTLYITGDVARMLPDNTIGFIGRHDAQIQIRGNRVEPGEVEACIREIEKIDDVTVQAVSTNNSKELCAYVVGSTEDERELYEQVTKYVANSKPSFMVPAFVVKLDTIPLNTNGKVDKRRLPEPDTFNLKATYIPAKNEAQQQIIDAFEKVLQVTDIGIDDDFIRLGGDSLKAIQVVSHLKEAGLACNASDIISFKTPKNISSCIVKDKKTDIVDVEQVFCEWKDALKDFAIQKSDELNDALNRKTYIYPLTQTQLNFYLDDVAYSKALAYVMPDQINLEGNYSPDEAYHAIQKLINLHPILKTKVVIGHDGPVGVCEAEIDIKKIILNSQCDKEKLKQKVYAPFNTSESLCRFYVVQKDGKVSIVYAIHHMIADAYTLGLIEKEITLVLEDKHTNKADLGFMKAAKQSLAQRSSIEFENAHNFFAHYLAELDDTTTAFAPYTQQTPGKVRIGLDELSGNHKSLLNKLSITAPSLFVSIFAFTLSIFVANEKVCFNFTEHGRRDELDFESVGMYVRSIPLIIDCSKDTLRSYLKTSFESVMSSMQHSIYPLRSLINEFGITNEIAFECNTIFGNEYTKPKDDISYTILDKDAQFISDFQAILSSAKGGYVLNISHTNSYSKELVISFAQTFKRVYDQIASVEKLEDITCTDNEDIAIASRINEYSYICDYPDIIDTFKDKAHSQPDAPCISDENATYTYKQVDIISDVVAQKLKDSNLMPQGYVAILTGRNVCFTLSMIACLKGAYIYIPIDESQPIQRISQMLSLCSCKYIITTDYTYSLVKDVCNVYENDIKIIKIDERLITKSLNSKTPFKCAPISKDTNNCILFTSGTTGIPKGVVNRRITQTNLAYSLSKLGDMGRGDVYGLYASFGYSPHLDSLSVFINGGSINIVPDEVRLDMKGLCNYFDKHNITHTFMSSSITYRLFSDTAPKTLKVAYRGGEAVKDFKNNTGCKIMDEFGCTECSNIFQIDAKVKTSINELGYPIDNTHIYALDRFRHHIPIAAKGYLYISGNQLSSNYLDDKESSFSSFIQNSIETTSPFEMMYPSADVISITKNGHIYHIGRNDSVIKIRGNRVELGEVESCIREINSIDDVCVYPHIVNDVQELCAYVVPANKDVDQKTLHDTVAAYIADKKPSYMIPEFVIKLDEIPLNVNGKVDRRSLPKPDASTLKEEYIKAQNKIQQTIIAAFEEVLQITPMGIDDDFIRLGGDSLKAIQVSSQIKDISISVADILRYKTCRNIYQAVMERDETSATFNLYSIDDAIPLTEPQFNVYLDIKANEKKDSYFVYDRIDIGSDYSIAQVKNALNCLFEIHPILSYCIKEIDGKPCLIKGKKPQIEVIKDAAILSKEKLHIDIEEELCRFAITKDDDIIEIYAIFSHMIFDASSHRVLRKSIQDILEGKSLKQDTAYLKAASFAQSIQDTNDFKNAKEFFDEMLADIDDISLPIKDIATLYPGRRVKDLSINKEQIDAFCKENAVSESVLFSAAAAFMLSRFCGGDKTLFHVLDNGRDRYKAQESIGMFVTTLPIVIDCGTLQIADFINQCSNKLYKMMSYSYYPNRLLLKKYGTKASTLFQYRPDTSNDGNGFVTKKDDENFYDRADMEVDLCIVVCQFGDCFDIEIEYSCLYSEDTINRMLDAYEHILNGFLTKTKLKDIIYTTKEDIHEQDKLNKTQTPLEHTDILQALDKTFTKYPNNILVTYEDTSFTYAQGVSIASQIADKLTDAGVHSQVNVAILVPRSEYYLLCALGVLITGATYIPIDDTYPDERISFMLATTKPKAILVTNDTLQKTQDLITQANIDTKIISADNIKLTTKTKTFVYHKPNPKDCACILFTSGTTARPKCFQISHLAINNFMQWFCDVSSITETDTYALYAAFGFNVHLEMFSPLYCGAKLAVIPQSVRLEIDRLIDYLDKQSVTVIEFPVSVAKLIKHKNLPQSLCIVHTGGEVVGNLKFDSGNTKLLDTYGLTENTINVTCIDTKIKTDPSSIGYTLPNTKIYVLDTNKKRIPKGAIGQLYISGYQLAKPYIKGDGETSKSFLDNPFDGNIKGFEKMYATGDMVRFLPDGTLGFIGRADTQIKIRGNRVELGEIEASIREIEEVTDVTVQAIDVNKSKELCAYVVSEIEDEKLLYKIVTKHVTNTKPNYMVPAFVVYLDTIPLNDNGKINIQALPVPDASQRLAEYIAPTTYEETILCDAIAKVRGLDRVGVLDNLASMGFNSLNVLQVAALVTEFDLEVAQLMANDTVRDILKNSNKYKKHNKGDLQESMQTFSQRVAGDSDTLLSERKTTQNNNTNIPITDEMKKYFYGDEHSSVDYECSFSNTNVVFNLNKSISTDAFKEVCQILLRSHPYLGATFDMREDGVYIVDNTDRALNFRELFQDSFDISSLYMPYNLIDNSPLYRLFLINDAHDNRIVYFDISHVLIDDISLSVLSEDMSALLSGKSIKKEQFSFFDYALEVYELKKNNEHVMNEYYSSLFASYTQECALWFNVLAKRSQRERLKEKMRCTNDDRVQPSLSDRMKNYRKMLLPSNSDSFYVESFDRSEAGVMLYGDDYEPDKFPNCCSRILGFSRSRIQLTDIKRLCRNLDITINSYFTGVFVRAFSQSAGVKQVLFTKFYNGRNIVKYNRSVGCFASTLPVYIDAKTLSLKGVRYYYRIQSLLRKGYAFSIFSYKDILKSNGISVPPMSFHFYEADVEPRKDEEFNLKNRFTETLDNLSMKVYCSKNDILLSLNIKEEAGIGFAREMLKRFERIIQDELSII